MLGVEHYRLGDRRISEAERDKVKREREKVLKRQQSVYRDKMRKRLREDLSEKTSVIFFAWLAAMLALLTVYSVSEWQDKESADEPLTRKGMV